MLSRGTALRARQMTPGGSRGTRGSFQGGSDELFPDNPGVADETLLFTEGGHAIVTESGSWMTIQ